ncbi:MAG: prepilin-type N-terminal cleavage/methylation domain-containing protein, partial [Acidobacteria bacterium]|nr:prepilin-type N-terminal cleavage/methylation domain-containing protein [Acidobacteriota bacterium]
MLRLKPNKGFSLTELLMVVAIGLIVTTVALPSLTNTIA